MGDLQTRPLDGPFGLEVQGLNLCDYSAEQVESLRALWQEHPLLLVRGQLMTEAALMRFSAEFGELERIVRTDIQSRQNPEVVLISNLRDEQGTPLGGLGSYDLRWHTDQSYRTKPATGAIFFALEVPPEGGDTYWANTQMAYEALPEDLRAELDDCRGQFAYQMYEEDIGDKEQEIRALTPDAVHPVVLTHPVNGRKSLYIDPTQTFALEGLPAERADALLRELKAHLVRPEFTYRHRWQLGDVMLWDNSRLLHRRDPYDARHPRLAKRTTIFLRPEHFPVPYPA